MAHATWMGRGAPNRWHTGRVGRRHNDLRCIGLADQSQVGDGKAGRTEGGSLDEWKGDFLLDNLGCLES